MYIARYPALAVILLMLLALAPAMAQNVVYQGDTTTFVVDQKTGDTYTWELYSDSTVNFAQVPGDSSPVYAEFVGGANGPSVNVEWKEPGTYFFKVTANSSCTNNLKIGKIKVIEAMPKAVLEVNPEEICEDEWAELVVKFSARGPWRMKLETKDLINGTTTFKDYDPIEEADNPLRIPVGPKTTTQYTVVEVSNKFGVQTIPSNLVILTVHPLPQKTPIYLKKP